MKSIAHPSTWAVGILLVVAGLLVSTAKEKSIAYDEVIYAPMGVLYWTTGNYQFNRIHPPLQKLISALPLLYEDLKIPSAKTGKTNEWRLGYQIFFRSPTPGPKLVFLSRLPSILISLLLCLFLFLFVRRFLSPSAALISLLVLSFDPLFLGNGALAMNDIFVTAFFFGAVGFFHLWTQREKVSPLLCGLLTGAAITSKLSGILLLPFYSVMFIRSYGKMSVTERLQRAKGLGIIFGVAVLFTLLLYRFNVPLLLETFKAEASIQTGVNATGFLLGAIPGNGTWYYYPIATIIKTPLPILLLWLASLWILLKEKNRPSLLFPLLLAAGLVWGSSLLSRNRFGLRYLLPASPCLAALVGLAFSQLKKRRGRTGYALLTGWLIVETLIFHPHHMAYFNEIIGGPKKGYLWLDGSNQDWGQDLTTLSAFLKEEGNPAVFLGYCGSGDPRAWGIHYQDVLSPAIASATQKKFIYPTHTRRELLVVSARLRSDPQSRAIYDWIGDRQPIAFLGYTLFIYDITQDVDAVLKLADIYEQMGRRDYAERQRNRAKVIRSLSRG